MTRDKKMADIIGIGLVVFLAWFFVDMMFPGPKKKLEKRPDSPIEPNWR